MSLPPQTYRPPPPKEKAPGALALLDESFHRLRQAPLGVLGTYYAGTLPFVLAILYFWGDLTHGGAAALRRSTGAALGLTLIFLWMKGCHALFALRLREGFSHRPPTRLTVRALLDLFIVQAVVHSAGLFVLAIASVLTLPFGWAYAFCQSATAIGAGDGGTAREVLRRSWNMMLKWPKQNHLMLLVLSVLGLFVWSNLLVMVFLLPRLAKLFTGEENMFVRSETAQFNSTTFTVTMFLAYLALDPVVKTFYALRCFYAESLFSGEDIRGELHSLSPVRTGAASGAPAMDPAAAAPATRPRRAPVAASATAAVLVCVFAVDCLRPAAALAAVSPPAAGGGGAVPVAVPANPVPEKAAGGVRATELDNSIAEVMRRREFAWRLPPAPADAEEEAPNGLFQKSVKWLQDIAGAALRQIGRVFDSIQKWWRDLQKKFSSKKKWENRSSFETPNFSVNSVLLNRLTYVLIAAIIVVGLIYFWKQYRRGRAAELPGTAADLGTLAEPDLADEAVVASQLPEFEPFVLGDVCFEGFYDI